LSTLRLPGLEAWVCSGLTLSGDSLALPNGQLADAAEPQRSRGPNPEVLELSAENLLLGKR